MTLESSLRRIRGEPDFEAATVSVLGSELKAGWYLGVEGCPSVGVNLQDGCLLGQVFPNNTNEAARVACITGSALSRFESITLVRRGCEAKEANHLGAESHNRGVGPDGALIIPT